MERKKLNLVPTGLVENVHASQYDIARVFRFDLMDGADVYTLDGTETITVDVTQPDGTETTISVDNTSSSYVDVVTPAGVCDLSGSTNCELKIVKGGVEIGSQNFSIKVEKDPHDNKIVLRTASGVIASFNTDLAGILQDCTSELPYSPNGYTSASVINSKTTPVFDLAPYLTRANSNTGNLALEKLVGLTVCFNQLANNSDLNATQTVSDVTYTNNGDGSFNISGTATANSQKRIVGNSWITTEANHKFYVGLNQTIANCKIQIYANNNITRIGETQSGTIISNTTNTTALYAYVSNGDTVNITGLKFNIFDLTAMFGSEVADYLYTLESGTAGAGVSAFKSLFGADYYPYTANTLMSAKPTGKVIKDENDQTIETIVYSGNELRGLIKVGANGLYADGDIDDGSGSTQVRYGIVDLGSLTYSYDSGIFINYKSAGIDIGAKGRGIDFVGSSYSNSGTSTSGNMPDKSLQIFGASGNANLWIKDSGYNDATALKTALNGVYIVYELASPTTATSTAWSNPIQAKQGGTETFVDTRTIALPTGHDTIYGTDMVVKTADFGQTVYGGSVDFTTGEVISNKNADGTNKTPETIAISPVMVGVFEGDNNIVTTAGGNNTVKYYKGA